jgi:CRISPR-associated protein Csm2
MARNRSGGIDLGITSQALRQIIVEDNAQVLVESAEKIGFKLGRDLTTNQIRAIFGTVRQIEMNWDEAASDEKQRQAQRDLVLLKPKMLYRASKEGYRGKGLQALAPVLSEAIDFVTDERVTPGEKRLRFGRFAEFFEAILAYHKVAGGN